MCDPITIGMAALGGAAALFGNKDAPAPPPPPVIQQPLQAAQTPGAVVKVGDGVAASTSGATPDYQGFNEKRVFGKPLGGLGKGGLGL